VTSVHGPRSSVPGASTTGNVIVDARNVSRIFSMSAGPVTAVRDVTLQINSGDHIAVRGPSGCGKSTLLHMLGCVEPQTSGTLLFDGQDVSQLSDSRRSLLRLKQIGFVFQRFFLLPMLTAQENVELPLSEAGVPKQVRQNRAVELLEYVGLAARADHRPSQLSGGEMQRVAIARALANGPRLLLADEPTGELDEATGAQIASLLDRVNQAGTALVIVTHDPALADRAARVLMMRDGQIESERIR
jgi:putative ABC transport system ATP-binding protein